jgi:hypothetical protein
MLYARIYERKRNMKKIYVKPEAFSVAFAVNENIAFSGDITMSSGGEIKYVQSGEGCNKFLSNTGIATGLKEGCIDYNHMMGHISLREDPKYGTDLKELDAILAKLAENEQDFVCAGPNSPL